MGLRILAAAALLVSAPQPRPASPLRIHLSVDAASAAAWLTFRNISREDARLCRWMVCADGHARPNVLSVLADGDRFLRARTTRPSPCGPDDEIVLAPSDEFRANLELADDFEFLPGRHDYEAQYNAFLNLGRVELLYELHSNRVAFSR